MLGAEQVRWIRRFLEGLEVSDETLAMDVICEVGPAGQFLDKQHTVDHLRDHMWKPLALDHEGYDAWESSGSKDYAARARARVAEVLETHRVAPLDDATASRLRGLAQAKERP